MDASSLNLTLIPAPDELSLRSEACQKDVRAFAQFLSTQGIQFSNSSFDVREAWSPEPVSAVYLGDFTVKLIATIVPPLITGLAGWLHGRNARRVHLKVGDIQVDAPSIAEVERLLASAQAMSKMKRKS
jgi:hypothetical protein